MKDTQPTQIPPNEAALRQKVINYLKDCKPKYYRQLKKDGELEEYITGTVARTVRYANNLLESGMFESDAWSRAIREDILEVETD